MATFVDGNLKGQRRQSTFGSLTRDKWDSVGGDGLFGVKFGNASLSDKKNGCYEYLSTTCKKLIEDDTDKGGSDTNQAAA